MYVIDNYGLLFPYAPEHTATIPVSIGINEWDRNRKYAQVGIFDKFAGLHKKYKTAQVYFTLWNGHKSVCDFSFIREYITSDIINATIEVIIEFHENNRLLPHTVNLAYCVQESTYHRYDAPYEIELNHQLKHALKDLNPINNYYEE